MKKFDLDKCQSCSHFYECDNMGTYEKCLPSGKYFEPKEEYLRKGTNITKSK